MLNGRVSAVNQLTTTVPAAAPGPRDYMTQTLFPAVLRPARCDTLDKPVRAEGEQLTSTRMYVTRRSGYDMTTLDGTWAPVAAKEFPAGSSRPCTPVFKMRRIVF
jgi:hypothetical protein